MAKKPKFGALTKFCYAVHLSLPIWIT